MKEDENYKCIFLYVITSRRAVKKKLTFYADMFGIFRIFRVKKLIFIYMKKKIHFGSMCSLRPGGRGAKG